MSLLTNKEIAALVIFAIMLAYVGWHSIEKEKVDKDEFDNP